MKLYYARHGQTAWNAQNSICSRADIPLNSAGISQAEALALEVARLDEVDRIAASPMLRAKQTAEIVAQAIGKPIFFDERLREWDFGRLEGADREQYAQAIRQFRGAEFALPLGETGETLLRLTYRVYSALEDIKENYAGKTVLVITHGGVCRTIATYFQAMTAEEFTGCMIGNCELRVGEF